MHIATDHLPAYPYGASAELSPVYGIHIVGTDMAKMAREYNRMDRLGFLPQRLAMNMWQGSVGTSRASLRNRNSQSQITMNHSPPPLDDQIEQVEML